MSGWNNLAESIVFKDILALVAKKKIDFNHDKPFIINHGKQNPSCDHTSASLYIPMRYLDDMGYKIKRTKEIDPLFITIKKKILVTDQFQVVLELTKTEDFEEQKKALLKLLETCKSREDMATMVRRATRIF